MEAEPNNTLYIDEYPHLAERVSLRRMGQLALFELDETDPAA